MTVELNDLIDDDQLKVVARCLSLSDEDDLQDALRRLARAAVAEYIEVLSGKYHPRKVSEFRERRLYHLIKHYFDGRMPDEAEVVALFRLTNAESKTLLRNVRTKYSLDLETEMLESIKGVLDNAQRVKGGYRIVTRSASVIEELRQKVSEVAPHLDQISKVRNSAGVYEIPQDTYNMLVRKYGLSGTVEG